jgi:hypothetical protein
VRCVSGSNHSTDTTGFAEQTDEFSSRSDFYAHFASTTILGDKSLAGDAKNFACQGCKWSQPERGNSTADGPNFIEPDEEALHSALKESRAWSFVQAPKKMLDNCDDIDCP